MQRRNYEKISIRNSGSSDIVLAKIGSGPKGDCSLKIGLRPEHLIPDDNGPIEITILNSEPLGANTLLHGKLTSTGDFITASIPGVYSPESKNTKKQFSIDSDNIHLFDLKTEKRYTV